MWRQDTWNIISKEMSGKAFKLKLRFHDWYGYSHSKRDEVVEAVRDGVQGVFRERHTKKVIADDDIIAWWKD